MLNFVYVFTQPLYHGQDAIQSQFHISVKLTWIQSLPSPTLIGIPRLKSSNCPSIYKFGLEKLWFMPFPRKLAWSKMQTASESDW